MLSMRLEKTHTCLPLHLRSFSDVAFETGARHTDIECHLAGRNNTDSCGESWRLSCEHTQTRRTSTPKFWTACRTVGSQVRQGRTRAAPHPELPMPSRPLKTTVRAVRRNRAGRIWRGRSGRQSGAGIIFVKWIELVWDN